MSVVTFLEDLPFFSVRLLQGESVSEEPNCVFPLESTTPTLITLLDLVPRDTNLPTNQVPWITDYRRNIRKEVGSPTAQPTSV